MTRETHVVSTSTLVQFEMPGGRQGCAHVQKPIKLRLLHNGSHWLCYADMPAIAIARHTCRESAIGLCLQRMMIENVNLQEHPSRNSDQELDTRIQLENAFYGLQIQKNHSPSSSSGSA